ncbi:LIM-domain binding protein-domain-containing protein [Parasitella parasitica]|nr:LIM-domain binding protein-domain-containing protein [Parasitella parasitica]
MQQQQSTPRISALPPSTPVMVSQGSPAPAMSKMNSAVDAQQSQTSGQAVLRLLQFAEQLSPGQEEAVDRLFWDNFVQSFFTMQGTLKLGLTNVVDNEQKNHEVNQALLARFFHTQYLCGVVSIQMTLDKTMEYILPGGIMYVQCPRASFINRYKNGTLVISTGPLWVQFVMTANGEWKIGHMDFSCQGHEEYVTRTTIKTEPVPSSKKKIPPHQSVIPESPINNWGLPPRVYHILQIADIALRTSEVVFHSIVSGSSARESLGAVAFDKQPRLMMKNDSEDMKPHPIDTPIVSGMATVASTTAAAAAAAAASNSPIVKTQTGRPHQPFTPLQQQAALRQQQQQAAFQFHQQQQRQQQMQLQQQQGPLTPGHQMAYQQQLQLQQQQQQAQQHIQQQQLHAQSQPQPPQQPAYPNQFPAQSPVSRMFAC